MCQTATMADQDILTALDAAILAQVDEPLSLTHNGRSITYRSLDELVKARAEFAQAVATTAGACPLQFHHFKAGGP